MYMNDIKLFAKNKNKKELETQNRIYSEYIGVEFGREKCAILIMKSRKRLMTEGIEQLNQEKIRTLGEKKTYKSLGILEADTFKQAEMKEKIKRVSKENEKTTRNQTT